MRTASRIHMQLRGNGLRSGLYGGIAGLVAMELVQRLTKPLVKQRSPSPMDVFATERSISLIGPHHEKDESATTALGRIAYERVTDRKPSRTIEKLLSWGVHIGYGLLVATAFGAIRGHRARPVRDGIVFGTGLWLLGDELAVPLLGLADKPTAYHPTRHLQSLVAHLGFGIATAAVARHEEDEQ